MLLFSIRLHFEITYQADNVIQEQQKQVSDWEMFTILPKYNCLW